MKNNSLIFNGILAIALLILYILYFTNNNNSASGNKPKSTGDTKSAKTIASDGKNKFAFINSDTLLMNYEFYKVTKKDLETKQRLIDSDLRNRQSAFQNSVISFQNTAGTMTQQKIEETKQSLGLKEQELMQYGKSQEVEYLKEEQKLNEKLRDNVNEFIKKYAEEKGYTYIFGFSKNNAAIGLMYGEPANDITQEVLVGLNEEYKNSQKKK